MQNRNESNVICLIRYSLLNNPFCVIASVAKQSIALPGLARRFAFCNDEWVISYTCQHLNRTRSNIPHGRFGFVSHLVQYPESQ
jgi:hypothetical protein